MESYIKRNKAKIIVASLPIFLVIYLFVQWSLNTETYSWNQKVTVSVETSSGMYESSTIHQIEWKKNWCFFPAGLECDRWTVVFTGDAPLVELPTNAVILATIGGGTKYGFSRMLVDQFENSRNLNIEPREEFVQLAAESSNVTVELTIPLSPGSVTLGFVDKNDAESIFYVSSTTPAYKALGIQKVTLLVEKTEDELVESTISQTLPWLLEMGKHDRLEVDYGTYMGRPNIGRVSQKSFSSQLLLKE
jgi:hypothetical protein